MHGLHTGHLADGVLDRNGPSRVELKPGGLHTHPPGCIGYNGQLDLGVNYSRHSSTLAPAGRGASSPMRPRASATTSATVSRGGCVGPATGEVLHGQIVPTLANISRQVAMVVLGYRGQGAVAGALLGSVSSSLVRHAHGPVAVIPEEPRPARPPHAPVVVGIDGSPTSGLAAEIAFDEASRRGVDLVALHAWSDMGPLDFPRLNWAPIEWRNLEDEQEKMLARRLSGWQDRYPDVVVHKVVVCDRPAPRLLELAQTAQLVVVGSHGRGGFPGMHLGSVSRAVVNSGQAPVIVARIPQDPAVPA